MAGERYTVEIRVPHADGTEPVRCSTHDSLDAACAAAKRQVAAIDGGVARVGRAGDGRTLHVFYGPHLSHVSGGDGGA